MKYQSYPFDKKLIIQIKKQDNPLPTFPIIWTQGGVYVQT